MRNWKGLVIGGLGAIALIVLILTIGRARQEPVAGSPGVSDVEEVPEPALPPDSEAFADAKPIRQASAAQTSESKMPVAAAADAESTAILSSLPSDGPGLIVYGRATFQDGSPAVGAIIRLRDNSRDNRFDADFVTRGLSDADGRYRVATRDGYHRIRAELAGYAPAESVIDAVVLMTDASGVRRVRRDFVLLPGAELRGRVLDSEEQPIAGADVTAVSMDQADFTRRIAVTSETTSGDDGAFDFPDAVPGASLVVASADGFDPAAVQVTAPDIDVVVRLQPAEGSGVIEGAVFLKSTGKGVPGARVRLMPDYRHFEETAPQWVSLGTREHALAVSRDGSQVCEVRIAQTDDGGLFQFTGVPANTYLLGARKDGLHPIYENQQSDLKLDLADGEFRGGIELFLYEGHRISGRVLDKTTENPIEGVEVHARTLLSDMGSDLSDSQGRYVVYAWGDDVSLAAQKDGYALADSNKPPRGELYLNLKPEALELTRDIHMTPALTVSGRVVRPDDSPAGDSEISASVSELWRSFEQFQPVQPDGTFTLALPPFTAFTLLARAPGYAVTFSEPMNLQDQPIRDVELRLVNPARASGVVVDESDQPVAGATVRCWAWFSKETPSMEILQVDAQQTDEDGRFTLSEVPITELEIWADKPGYAQSEKEKWSPSPGDSRNDLKLVLRRALQLAGRVVDPDGNPLAGVEVLAIGRPNSFGGNDTDSDGQFRIQGLADRPHEVRAIHPEYGMRTVKDVRPGDPPIEIVLGEESGYKFIGRVKDATTGEPVEDFEVRLDLIPMNTLIGARKDPDTPGLFVVPNLTAEHRLRINLESPRFPAYQSTWFWFQEGQKVIEQTFELGTEATILGRVVDKATGQPMPGISVALKSASNPYILQHIQPQTSQHTDAEGRFRFERAMAGHHVVIVAPGAPRPEFPVSLEIKHGETRDLGDIAIGQGTTVNGRLYRMPANEGIADTVVEMTNHETGFVTRATTDADGAFHLEGLPSGRYLIKCPRFDLVRFITLEDETTMRVDLVLGGASVRGRVLRAEQPVICQVVIYQDGGALQYSRLTGADGGFAFENLTPGRWTLNAHDQLKHTYRPLDLAEGDLLEVDLVFPAGRLRGRVVDSNDDPVGGADVSLQRVQTPEDGTEFIPKSATTASGADGAFEFTDLPEGTYRVTARKEGVGMDQRDDAWVGEIEGEEILLRLGASGGTLISRTVNVDTKAPIPDATLTLFRDGAPIPQPGDQRNDAGVLEVPNLMPGDYKVRVGGDRYSVAGRDITIREGETTSIDDALYEAGTMAWRIQDSRQMPLEVDCRIVPVDPSSPEPPREGKTMPVDGRWWEEGLRPGDYRGTATLSDGRTVAETFTIRVGERTDVTTTVPE